LIATATESATEITFDDQTQLSIGPESQVTLDEFIYDPNSHAGSLAIAVTVGVIRLASGDMNEEGVVITTPVATIGIRGTIVTVSVAADGTTTVSVEQGAADVSSASGGSQSVAAGLSTTVAPGAPPSPPSPPPPAAVAAITGMDNVLGTGVAAGEGGGAFGEITPLVPAAGALAVIGVVIAVTAGGGQPSSPTTTGTSGTAP
jgi:ferric-dicitrate binding protein FerR (iron transport regulator)